MGGLHRRIRIIAGAWAFEGIAARLDLPLQIAGLAADAVEIFEAIEVRLELVIGDAPVLTGAVLGELARPVAREGAAPRLEIPRQEAPGDAVPVNRRAADAFAREEGPHLAHRQRRIANRVAEGERLARQVLHQLVAAGVTELVVRVRHVEVGVGVAPAAALQAHDLEACVGELFREDGAGEADTHGDDVDRFQLGGHALPLRTGA